jgi:membrane associated rhomboid family serine protease
MLVAGAAVGPAIRARRRLVVPTLTGVVLVVLIVCAVAQIRVPPLLAFAERSEMVEHGQVWRLLTAPWFQDGGLSGTLLNLVMLVVIGWVAEAELDRRCWIGAYACGALAGGLAGLAWQPVGAGNSIAVLGLAGAVFAARALRAQSLRQRLAGAWPLLICLAMAGLRDIHGAAGLAGALVGLICVATTARFRPTPTAESFR